MNPQQPYPPQQGPQPQPYPPQGPPAGYPQQPQQGPMGYPQQPGPGGYIPPYPQQQGPQGSPGPMGQPNGMQQGPPQSPGYNPYAFTDEYAMPPVKKAGPSKMILAGIGILGLVAVAILVLTMTSNTGNNSNDGNTQDQGTTTSTSTANKDVVDRSDGLLDLSSKITLSKTLKAQSLQGKVKQQVNLSSGFSFMVNKLENYTSPNDTTKPADGKKFIVATVVVGNRLDTGNLSVSYLDFRLRGADNTLIAGHVVTNELLDNKLASPSELKPGEQITGKVVFEVNASDTSWVLKHSETYQKTTDNTTFNVEGEIVVDISTATDSSTSTSDTTSTTTPSATPSTTSPTPSTTTTGQ
jgi:hypothetical protein